jgi:hypothetical protein
MDLDDYLKHVELIDCRGAVSHRLTVLLDGTVRVRVGHVEAVLDPTTRLVSPPGAQLGRGEYGHDQVVDIACSMSGSP